MKKGSVKIWLKENWKQAVKQIAGVAPMKKRIILKKDSMMA